MAAAGDTSDRTTSAMPAEMRGARRFINQSVARLWYGSSVRLCVFDLDHTLVSSPLDLAAMALEMRAYIEGCRGPLPAREERYRVGELVRWCRDHAPDLSEPVWDIALEHERRAVESAWLEPGAREALAGARTAGFATALWTNNAREVTQIALDRFALADAPDLVVTRAQMAALKPRAHGRRATPRPPGRSHATALDRRDRGPGAPARPRPRAARGARARRAALDDPLGPAGLRQDHAGLADGARHGRALRRVLGRAVGREGDPSGRGRGRDRARAPPATHDPLRRRDPPLQPRAAGRVPAARREGHPRADRRHHREPVVRGERRAPVALPRVRAAPARRARGDRDPPPRAGRSRARPRR